MSAVTQTSVTPALRIIEFEIPIGLPLLNELPGSSAGWREMTAVASIYGAAACVVIAIMAAACWLAMVVMDVGDLQ